ncbi:MAG: SusF/SusE family outer membrane protein [Bacteroidales bacterium]|nr:SusF/SusE family outer membrane protein [Bacteroidales bacterium]
MKIIKYTLSILALVLAFTACTKDSSNNVVFDSTKAVSGTLSAPAAIVLLDATKGNNLTAFTWTPSTFGFDAAITYTVEIALQGNNFATTKILGTVSTNRLVIKGSDLQSALDGLKVILGNTHVVEMRVKSQIVDQVTPIYSNVVNYNVTTFMPAEKEYNKVWIVGDYCGWNHDNSQFLYDVAGDKQYYEGWVAFSGKAQNGFKITYKAGWGDDIGTNDAAVVNNKIKVEPGGNIGLFNGSIMLLKLDNRDQANRTLELKKTISRIGLIGSATPNGWNTPDTELTFNTTKRVFEATIVLTDGEIKFRADNDWGLNWGKFDASAGKNPNQLNPGGPNIPVTAGTYKVEFNLNKVDPTYKLTLVP